MTDSDDKKGLRDTKKGVNSEGRASAAHSATLKTGISDRLVAIRAKLQKSQPEMDAALAIGKRSWQRYESGTNVPGGAVIAKLVDLGFDANWILSGEGPQLRESPAVAEERGDYRARTAIEALFIRNAVKLVEKRLGADADVEQKARLVAEVAADLQSMHDQEWAEQPEK